MEVLVALIEELQQFCKDNYENGYDVPVECWEDEEWVDWIATFKVVDVDTFTASYQFMIDHAEEIRSTAW